MPHLSISLLGTLQVMLDDKPVTAFDSDKTRALLAYLVVESARPCRREQLAGLFWPESTERRARASLSQALHNLRKALRDTSISSFLLRDQQTIQFNSASDYFLDVTALLELLTGCAEHKNNPAAECSRCRAQVEKAAELYRGDFLMGFSLPDCAAFEEWQLMMREHLQLQVADAITFFPRFHTQSNFETQTGSHLQIRQVSDSVLAVRQPVEDQGPALQLPPFLDEQLLQRTRPQLPFAAREVELAQMHQRLEQAIAGKGQVLFVTGEAGRGKTALLQAFVRQARARYPDIAVVGGSCNAFIGGGDPYLPFRQILALLTGDIEAQWRAGTITRAHALQLWRLLPKTTQALLTYGSDLIGTLVDTPSLLARTSYLSTQEHPWLKELQTKSANVDVVPHHARRQSALMQQYSDVIQAVSQQTPLLLLVDDLQWADPSTVNLLFHLSRTIVDSSILFASAYRPAELITDDGKPHPLEMAVNELRRYYGNMAVALAKGDNRAYIDALVDLEPNHLDEVFRTKLLHHTQGNSLFTLELLRAMRVRADLIQDDDKYWIAEPELDWDIWPARVEAVIDTQIERLPPILRQFLMTASVEGEIFTAEVLADIHQLSRREVAHYLGDELDRQHRLILLHGVQKVGEQQLFHYRFRHILFQKYLYNRLSEAEQLYLHSDIGICLAKIYAQSPEAAERQAGQIARHFAKAHQFSQAAEYYHLAGKYALKLSAIEDAIDLLRQGVEMIQQCEQAEAHLKLELALYISLGAALVSLYGYIANEVLECYEQAIALSKVMDDPTDLFTALRGLATFHRVSGRAQLSFDLSLNLIQVAEQQNDPMLVLEAYANSGSSLTWLGQFEKARQHFDYGFNFFGNHQHGTQVHIYGQDSAVVALMYHQLTLWYLGYPDQAIDARDRAIAISRKIEHPNSLAGALYFAGIHHILRREPELVHEFVTQVDIVANKNQLYFWSDYAAGYHAWVLTEKGEVHNGLKVLEEFNYGFTEEGGNVGASWMYVLHGLGYAKLGRYPDALDIIANAISLAESSGIHWWEAEAHRVKGKLLLEQDSASSTAMRLAENEFRCAIEIACSQDAKSWELRAATSLAKLYKQQNKSKPARELLEPIYNWFTEGFDTYDLKKAKALLDSLS